MNLPAISTSEDGCSALVGVDGFELCLSVVSPAKLLDDGYRTADILPSDPEAAKKFNKIGCSACGDLIAKYMTKV